MDVLRWSVIGLLGLLLCAVPAAADDKATAEAVRKAFEAGDDAALASLAAPKPKGEPWRVVDFLIAGGHGEAAKAYAAKVPRGNKDVAQLAAYVAEWADKPIDEASRTAVAAAGAALRKRDVKTALAELSKVSESAHPVLRVRAYQGLGVVLQATRNLAQSSKAWLAMAETADSVGWMNNASGASQRAGLLAFQAGAYRDARRIWQYRLDIEQRRESAVGEAAAFGNVGLTYWRLGNLPKAMTHMQRSAEMLAKIGAQGTYARALLNTGILHQGLSDFPRSIDYFKRAERIFTQLGDQHGLIAAASGMSGSYRFMGDYERARQLQKQALELEKDPLSRARLLINASGLAVSQGRLEEAEGYIKQAEAIVGPSGSKIELMSLRGVRGDLHIARGENEAAVKVIEESLVLADELNDRNYTAGARHGLAVPLHRLGRVAEAKETVERAVREAERLRTPHLIVDALSTLAWMHLRDGEAKEALAAARRAVPHFEFVVKGHAQDHGTHLRQRNADIYAYGAIAAAKLGDVRETAFFLEGGRAGSLLEALGGRDAIARSLPDALIEGETSARRAELAARQAYERASAGGKRSEIRAAAKAWETARTAVQHSVAEIQRFEKQNARTQLFYPTPATLEDVQDALKDDEAFVTYGVFERGSLALVVTPEERRVVILGGTKTLVAACEAVNLSDPAEDPAASLAALGAIAVEPLKLPKSVKRVLVSPSGALSHIPASLLFGSYQVACQPSATAYVSFLEDRPLPGRKVLALGDPAYDAARQGELTASLRRGSRLVPLPGTRAEVKAIGDVVLLGADASRPGLAKALETTKRRWRAVHFACHGLVDLDQPTQSSLALSPAKDDTGFLRALDVFHMKIPADLAVLSACETGRGRIVEGEGIVGLTHSFFHAGASSVLVSLWKVDDEATRELMTKFYELWNPKQGKGIPAALALKQAQAHVRGQEKWKHPYYWGAWVLWGLAD